tara:strand:+ start:234 stop:467 length:234 start_codon:yes stop_codon:yes gene_type:complete
MKITKSQLKQIIKEELQTMLEGNFQEKYCSKNPDAEGCLEYWQEEAEAMGITRDDPRYDDVDFNDAESLIFAIEKAV